MNERIKPMWEEATSSMWPRPNKFTAGEYDRHLEKFAELIVRECAHIAMSQHQSSSFASYDDLDDYERGQDDAASTISGQIRQHFGVK